MRTTNNLTAGGTANHKKRREGGEKERGGERGGSFRIEYLHNKLSNRHKNSQIYQNPSTLKACSGSVLSDPKASSLTSDLYRMSNLVKLKHQTILILNKISNSTYSPMNFIARFSSKYCSFNLFRRFLAVSCFPARITRKHIPVLRLERLPVD